VTLSPAPSLLSSALPIDPVLPELRTHLCAHTNVLLSAEPGAGKTTRVPLALLNEPWLAGQKIIMLEPRRLAARNAASFMAKQLNEQTGETVGYRIRLEQKISATTRIEVVTEGILTRMLQDDPELSGVGLIIFDEFHERNLHSDLALALAHQCQQLLRPELRLLVMSATLDTDSLGDKLQAPLLHSTGRSFKVKHHYRPLPNNNSRLAEHCASVIREALNSHHEGDVLVFLPGVADISRVQTLLQETLSGVLVAPLHGQLSDSEQKTALAPAPAGQRKVILATNIAESSLTIDGVRIVVDSGLERRMSFSPASGISQLQTRNISQASSVQRSGRAGRQAEGFCYRLWREEEQSRREPHIRAEILDADLAPLLLELLHWGADLNDLLWLSPPPVASLNQARQVLAQLGLLQPDAPLRLNEHGQRCAALGLEPRWAHALLCARDLDMAAEACELVAVLQEWPHKQRHSDDAGRLLSQARRQHSVWNSRIKPLAQRWQRQLQAQPSAIPLDCGLIIALAFPDRIAQKRSANAQTFRLSGGSGAELQHNSDLHNADYLAIADISGGQPDRIRLAAALDNNSLSRLQEAAPHLFSERTEIGWNDSGQLKALQHRCLGQLILSSKPLPALSADDWQQAWRDYFRQCGLNDLPWQDDARTLRSRMALAAQYLNTDNADADGHRWPDVSDQALLQRLDDWLMPFCTKARNLRDLNKVTLNDALLSLLSWEQQQQLNQHVPGHWQVASGSRIALQYNNDPNLSDDPDQPPLLAVKLQEMFGYEGQPAILNGRVPLLIHLLSPARRPLQVTRDLPHFWRHTYAEVRKDMRGRYPKHPWPEDPLSAEATALTKRALSRRQ